MIPCIKFCFGNYQLWILFFCVSNIFVGALLLSLFFLLHSVDFQLLFSLQIIVLAYLSLIFDF